MTEAEIIAAERLRLSPEGWRFWRTVPGTLWKGHLLRRNIKPHLLAMIGIKPCVFNALLESPTPVKLSPPGEPDLHLARPVTITPDMVGQTILQFGKAEVKTEKYKTVTKEQRENLKTVARMGGCAFIIRGHADGSRTWEEVRG